MMHRWPFKSCYRGRSTLNCRNGYFLLPSLDLSSVMNPEHADELVKRLQIRVICARAFSKESKGEVLNRNMT